MKFTNLKVKRKYKIELDICYHTDVIYKEKLLVVFCYSCKETCRCTGGSHGDDFPVKRLHLIKLEQSTSGSLKH